MRTLKAIRDEVLAWMDEAGGTGLTSTNVDSAINRAHELRTASHQWAFMLYPGEHTFLTVANQREYALHPQLRSMLWIWNKTKQVPLRETPFRQVSQLGLSLDGQLTAYSWGNQDFSYIGRAPVAAEPNGVVTATSTVSETAGLVLAGETASGPTEETLTFAGHTARTTSTSFTSLTSITKTGTWAGTLTLTDPTTTLLTLGATEYGKSYPKIMIYQAPPAGETILYRFYRVPRSLTTDYQITDIPSPHDGILVFDTLLLMTGYHSRISPVAVSEWQRLQQQALENLLEQESHTTMFGHPQTTLGDIYGS